MNQQPDSVASTRNEKDLSELTDRELVRLFQEGRESAFDEIVRRYQDYVFRNVYYQVDDQQAAEDLAQQTFLNMYEGLDDFEGRSSLKTWMYRILKNLCYSHHRKQGRNREQPVGTYSTSPDNTSDDDVAFPEPRDASSNPGDNVSLEEKKEIVQETIFDMKEQFREILVLREFEGHSYDEMAGMLEVPVGTVRSRLYRARDRLRELLEQRLGEELDAFLDQRQGESE